MLPCLFVREISNRPGRAAPLSPILVALMMFITMACQRPQLLLYVDTDAPVTSQLLEPRPEESRPSEDASIDRLLVEVRDEQEQLLDICDIPAADQASWPIGFGVPRAEGTLRVRLRAYKESRVRGKDVVDTRARCGVSESEALSAGFPGEIAIDRLVDLPPPGTLDRVIEHRVTLSLDCLSARPEFLTRTTCVDAERRTAGASVGLDEDPIERPSRVGSSPRALPRRCTKSPPPGVDAVCVYGGVTIMGDLNLVGLDLSEEQRASPWRPVLLSPFWMDVHELSIRELRALGGPAPFPNTQDPVRCTWNPQELDARADWPVTCPRRHQDARSVCQRRGGDLPSEAQWEHAARGRGRSWSFPWGNDWPSCDSAIIGRTGGGSACPGPVPDEVKTPTQDRSVDGVLHLAGNVEELTRDVSAAYAARCGLPLPGLNRDPVCEEAKGTFLQHVYRGSAAFNGLGTAQAARRYFWTDPDETDAAVGMFLLGFRCVYPGE